jgi:hypothetical protein
MEQVDSRVDIAEVSLDVTPEAGSDSCDTSAVEQTGTVATKSAANLDIAREDSTTSKMRLAYILIPTAMLLVGLAAYVLFPFHNKYTSGMHDKVPFSTPVKHVGVATDTFIVDDAYATNSGQKSMKAAAVGEAPYFHKWFGNQNGKAFHHDGGLPSSIPRTYDSGHVVSGTYKPPILTDGCYEVHEWHPTGPWSQMSHRASVEVTHAHGTARMHVDQSSQGGQWNYLASFNFKKDAAKVELSNLESQCAGSGRCFTTFDAFRFIYSAPECKSDSSKYKHHEFVFGSMLLAVPDTSSFIADVTVKSSLKRALAELAGVDTETIAIELRTGKDATESVVMSYRISVSEGGQPSALAHALDSTNAGSVSRAITETLLAAGSAIKVDIQDMAASLDGFALQAETTSPTPEPVPTTQPIEPSCMPATIINDFDSHLVKSVVSPGAQDFPGQGLEAFRPGRCGQKPYFHDWFGDILKKDFHHDAHINKGLLKVNYTTPLPQGGCYLLQEWHLGGNKYCVNYMPRRVPFHVHGVGNDKTVYADQSTNGGQWNSLGTFEFSTHATVVMSNTGTDDCLYRGQCYTVFDSMRFVRVGDRCDNVARDDASLDRMSDLACDESNSLAKVRSTPTQNEEDPSSAEASPAKLLEIVSPSADTTVAPGERLRVSWQTEGVASGTDAKISLLYDDEVLHAISYHMTSAAADIEVPVPSAQVIKMYSNANAGAADKFRIRIDMQHVSVELSNGWSNQLYSFSPFFTVKL